MPLSWNEIRSRAITFMKEWTDESREHAEAKSFWDGFFHVFGISRRRVASFEHPVKKLNNKQGFVDLLWKGVILIEHKSRGKSLDEAEYQADSYFEGLKEEELPRYVLVSDFQHFRLHDLDTDTRSEFELKDFLQHIGLFGFIAGYEKRVYQEEDPINIQAAELMGKIHDSLQEIGYDGHDLEVYLVRLLFCLFADKTAIFEKGIFWEYLDLKTRVDGRDLACHLDMIFQALSTPPAKRLKIWDDDLKQFPYVNGHLFEEPIRLAAFNQEMRAMLLAACALDWGKISPAIFGSMFQAVMNPVQRRNLGAHYTSEKNIRKVINSLFLDDLYKVFEKAKNNKGQLQNLHRQLASLKFLDPACGCGNFLIISYRELRILEDLILQKLYKHELESGQGSFLNLRDIIKVDVDQFYGIECEDFACQVAQVAMWLIDHQMNVRVSHEFGQYFERLPLSKAAKIVHGNSLFLDWEQIVAKTELSYILGNPPFVGKQLQSAAQKAEMEQIFHGVQGAGVLDYVTAWYLKAACYIQETSIACAFVSTSSITQGEQVGALWNELYNRYKIKIHFAHQPFVWSNEAKGNAAVHCVIIGFGLEEREDIFIYDYETLKSEPVGRKVLSISPYLTDVSKVILSRRMKPLCQVAEMVYGSKPADGGHLLMNEAEKLAYLAQEPQGEKFIRPFLGSEEFINGIKRWCFWLVEMQAEELKRLPVLAKRVAAVKKMRLASAKLPTVKWAQFPSLFTEIRQPDSNYLLIPRVSSEQRAYIPIGYLDKNTIASDAVFTVPNATLFEFGILTSQMHMAWMRYTCGRLKSDFRYSNTLVYNNFPFPQNVTVAQRKKVENAAQLVLEVRAQNESSLAVLYDALLMPPDLVKAHKALDKAVDLCYRPQVFSSELNRIEHLFSLYEQLVAPMLQVPKKLRAKKKTE
ncbi:MAG: class I SAM-dependent DNA methyltransferase [Thiotrichaceae bacterium]|nr:class I SAM-dependent DNA methyltransferase [Thiotrichaceae bacterium]